MKLKPVQACPAAVLKGRVPRTAVGVPIAGALLAAILGLGLHVNLSPSAPRGLYRAVMDLPKSDPISLDTVSTTMTGAKEVDDGSEKAEADSWQ